MPVRGCSNHKYRIGSGKCIYTSKKNAEKAYGGYRAAKHMTEEPETPPEYEINDDMKKDVIHQMSMREMIDMIEKESETPRVPRRDPLPEKPQK